MTSTGAAARRGPLPSIRAQFGQLPLWATLVAGLLVLSAIGLAVAGTAGAGQLRGYLVSRLDGQLESVAFRASHFGAGPFVGGAPGVLPRGPRDGFMSELISPQGAVVDQVPALQPNGQAVGGAPALDVAKLHSHAGSPFTVQAQGGSGPPWRVLVTSLPAGTLVVAASLADIDSTVARLVHIDLLVGLVVLLGVALGGVALVRASLRPLREIEATAGAIAAGDLSRRVPDLDPGTEVGQLAHSLNSMLAQIEAAFRAREGSELAARRSEERMRQFVADASHELRTPLTSIRGFAELSRYDTRDELDLRGLLSRVEDEARRMGLLVDDLLLLARLDEERPLQLQRVDLLALAADAVRDARMLQPERKIDLVLAHEAGVAPAEGTDITPADGIDIALADGIDGAVTDGAAFELEAAAPIVLGDEARLRQVAGNLVRNALAHTPVAAAVEVRLGTCRRAGRDMAFLEVADHGPGLPVEQAEHVFERFYRADRARSRAPAGGSGLGLAIVAAIVKAHGGTVRLETAEGQGATFTVELPLADELDEISPSPDTSRPAFVRPALNGSLGPGATARPAPAERARVP